MPFTKFSNLDFDQIKTSIKDYLRANSNFTDFDFEGSNMSILIDTLAYNTYITSFNSNLVVNESFLDSATLRENVVSLAGNIGYTPRSRTASTAQVNLELSISTDTPTVTLQPGLVCTGSVAGSSYIFSIVEKATTSVVDGIAPFSNLSINQGVFLKKKFEYDGSIDQRFILNNQNIDTSKIRVYVSNDSAELGVEYSPVNNIIDVKSTSIIYFLLEVQDERY